MTRQAIKENQASDCSPKTPVLFVGPNGGYYIRENDFHGISQKKYLSSLSTKQQHEIRSNHLPELKEVKFRVRENTVFGPIDHTDISMFYRQFPIDPLAKPKEYKGFPNKFFSEHHQQQHIKEAKAKMGSSSSSSNVFIEKVQIEDVRFLQKHIKSTELAEGRRQHDSKSSHYTFD